MGKLPDGFRWVEVRDYSHGEWSRNIFITKVGEKFLCVKNEEKSLEYFIAQEGKLDTVVETFLYNEMQEIAEPKKVLYTYDTWPHWARRVRNAEKCTQCNISKEIEVEGKFGNFISLKPEGTIKYDDLMDYEIAAVDGGWYPAYELITEQ